MEFTRREFLGSLAALAACSLDRAFASTQLIEKEPRVFDIYGLHDCPFLGGSPNSDRALADFKRLKVKRVVSLMPADFILDKTSKEGIEMIARAYMPENRFKPDILSSLIERLKLYYPNPIIQPFNEVNLPSQTGWDFRLPESHINDDFIPAAEFISARSGVTILTPPAPNALVEGISTFEYLERMMTELLQKKGQTWIVENNITLGLHPYIFRPEADHWEDVIEMDNMVGRLIGKEPPVYITEAGLHQESSTNRIFSEEVVAKETARILHSPIPSQLQGRLQAYCFWIYASEAQRTPNIPPGHPDDELLSWIGVGGDNLVAKAVENLAREN